MAMTAIAIFAAQAQAKDQNKNGVPDGWEKAHGISVKKDRGYRDADKDGAANRCEYQAKTDPNVTDSNGNGLADGAEDTDGDGATNEAESSLHSNCGRANSHLEIRRATVTSLADGTLVLTVKGGGTVTAPLASTLRCVFKGASASSKASKGKPTTKNCTTADLVAGAKVHNAKLKGSKFVAITILR
jgi:hypothetical protein